MDAFVDLFITLCIVINTMFMALDYHGMSDELAITLINGNYVSADNARKKSSYHATMDEKYLIMFNIWNV